MKSVDRAGAAGASFLAQSSKPGAQTSGVENWSSGNLCTANIVGFLASNASSCGPSEPLPTAKSAPFSDRSSLAVLHEQGDSIEVKTEDEEVKLAMPTREGSVGPASSLLYAVGKRTSSQAFSGNDASMQIHPALPRRPRWLSELAVGLSEDLLADHPHCASSQQRDQMPSFLRAVGQANTEFQSSQEVLEQLPEVMGAAILTECQSSGDIRGRCPESTSTLPAAPASKYSVLSGLSIGSSGTLSALLSGTSPAILEQLIAAALTGRTAASASAPAPDQVQASLAAASICSPEGVGGVAMRSKSFGSQYVHPEESQFAGPELTRRLQGGPDTGLDLSSRVSATTVQGREHLSARTAANASEVAKGSASGSGDDVSLTAPVSGQAARGGSGLDGEAGCGGVKDDDDGRGCENGIESTVSNLGGPGHSGNSDSVPSGFIGTSAVLPVPAAVLQPSITWESSARAAAGALAVTAPNLAGESAAGPAAQRASATPPDPPLVQASVPVSAQLGAAIPPELAARLKKPVRIIQPISQTWVEETLQCASGATRPPGSSNSRAGATAASTRGKQCPPSAPVGSDIDPKVSHCCGSGMTTVPTAGALPPRGTLAVGRKLGPSERLVSAPQSPKPASAAAMSAQPVALPDPALRCTPARVTRLLAVAVGTQAQQTAPQPSWDTFKPRTPVAPSTGEQPPQLTALAPAMAAMPLADNASPFTACSAALLLPPQQQATSAPTGGSAAAAMLPPTYDSNATTVSATWTVGTSPFTSSFGPGASGDAAVADPGPVGAADADAGCGASATAAPQEGAGPIAPGLDVPTSGQTIAALLGGSVPAGLLKPSRGVARSQSDRFCGPLNLEGLVAAQLPQQPAPAPFLPQRQPSASTGTASASCLGKVQGELTLLYQWYTANKTVYLDQAQRQLQRAEVLTAAHGVAASGGSGGGDAAAAASAKAEFGEAMRAFETAHNIMSVCGRVEQQWLSAAGLAGAGTDWRQLQVASPPLPRQGPMQPEADASGARLAVDMALDESAMDQAIHGPSAASAPLRTSGWANGASAALEVAAALVESVFRGQQTARGPSGMAPGSLAEQPAGAGPLPLAVRWDAKRRPVVGSGPLAVGEFCPQPTIGLPLSQAAQGPLSAAGTAAACASSAVAVAPPPAAPTMVAPMPLVMPPPLSPTTAAATPPIGPRSQATPA
ncbi:hypothetical protein Vretimale_10155 [Volvox reticuliferus]|uniref:Uncharacterized protein n=1 Tax=Volvox reticuliferus TaxID=1737510 RepID=A0A8J4BUJ6_9CHLO|nr:hypothetical protein Vretifemale_613 [Volvox reticuliferus]GIM05714.1 hypothetical protein Vretimale_10155 [Volvox reticuliferus]